MMLSHLLPGAVGYYLPQYWVDKRRRDSARPRSSQGFPDALDLMLVCVEAGQSLDQSIIRVGKESRAGYPALADEFDMVAQEVKAGKERDHGAEGHGRTRRRARRGLLRDHAGPVGHLRHLDRRGAAGLFGRNA